MKKLLSIILIITCLTGCNIDYQQIAYTVYPVGFLIDRIAGTHVRKESIQQDILVQRATIKSNYKFILDNSLILFHIGDLEPYINIYDQQITETGININDLSVLNSIYSFQRYTRVLVDSKESFIEDPYYNGDEFNLLDIHTRDLSIWMDPIGLLSMGRSITNYLANNNVENANLYRENFDKLEIALYTLDAQYQQLSNKNRENNKEIKFVSMTPSFGSWQKTYGFQIYPIMLSKYGSLPTIDQLEKIKQRIINDNVQYIAYESNMSDDMITLFDKLQQELNLERVNLSNLSSLSQAQKDAGKDYISIMYENLGVLENMVQDIGFSREPIILDEELIEEEKEEVKDNQEVTPTPSVTPDISQ